MKIFSIIKKNFLFLIRSKASSLILVYGPLLLIILIGIAFNNITMKDIKIGTYTKEYSDFTNDFIVAIESNTNFVVEKIDNESLCKEMVETNKLQLCIVFPTNMSLKGNTSNNVRFLVDPTKVNIVYFIMDRVSSSLELKKTEVSLDLTRVLVEKIDFAYKTITKNKPTIKELRANISTVKSNINNVYSSLDTLDLNFNMDDFPTEEIGSSVSSSTDSINSLYNQITSLTSIVSSKTSTISSYASDIMSDIGNASSPIYIKANDIESNAEELSSEASTKANNAYSYYNDVKLELEDIESKNNDIISKLYVVDVKFKSANVVRDSVSSDLKNNELILNKDIEKIDSLYSDLDSIVKSISEIEVKAPERIVSPIKTIIEPVLTRITHLNYLLPSLIVIVIMFIATMIGSTLIVVDKNSAAKFRNYISPTNELKFLVSHYITLLLFIIIQIIIIFAILSLAFNINLFNQFHILLLIVFIITTFFIFIGIIIGTLFGTEETTMTASIILNILLLLFSGIILPLEALSEKFLVFSKYNPFVISDYILKQFILFSKPISTYMWDFKMLLIYTGIAVMLSITVIILFKKRFYIYFKKQK